MTVNVYARPNYTKPSYILGIDGGGTKTLVRLIDVDTKEQWQASAGGSSLTTDFSAAIKVLESLLNEITSLADCSLNEVVAVFGLAGAGNVKLVQSLQQVFANRFAYLDICSDAKTSAYGANNGEEVAVVALGTGSVGMRLQQNKHGDLTTYLVGGWGFNIGDEGGGAKLGYHAVQALISEFQQHDKSISDLAQAVAEHIANGRGRINRAVIANWLSLAKPVDYAKIAPLVVQLQCNCSIAKKIMLAHVASVEILIRDTCVDAHLPVVLLGGLASVTQKLLSIATQKMLIDAKGNSLDGACLLAKNELIKLYSL